MTSWRSIGLLVLAAAGGVRVLAQQGHPLPDLPAGIPADARVYSKLTPGSPGRQVVWREPDGTYQVVYQFRLGDCVADVRSSITVDVAHVPVRLTHRGGACDPPRAIDETYGRDGPAGLWRNEAEAGEGDTVGKKFYLSRTRVPEEMALLVRALLANGHRTRLLPRGEASLERGDQLTVRAGDRRDTVTQYFIHGIAPEPVAVWLDIRTELFAIPPDFIRKGWEHTVGDLRRGSTATGPAARGAR